MHLVIKRQLYGHIVFLRGLNVSKLMGEGDSFQRSLFAWWGNLFAGLLELCVNQSDLTLMEGTMLGFFFPEKGVCHPGGCTVFHRCCCEDFQRVDSFLRLSCPANTETLLRYSIAVKTAVTETKTLSRLESIRIETRAILHTSKKNN